MTVRKKRIKPNFFIIGAPRCGTTAMSEYLRAHPKIFFSTPKEPDFFSTDLSFSKTYGNSEEGYLDRCFGGASGQHAAIGEGSVCYLYSKNAVPNILKFNPEAKFIVMLRNPAEVAYSLHSLKVFGGDENIEDFQTAWNLQEARRSGKDIPKHCQEPEFLQYGQVCKFGEQIERLYTLVPKENVLVLLFDDFKKDSKRVYEETLEFLGVSSDNRLDFPVINKSKRRRWKGIYNFIKRFKLVKYAVSMLRKIGIAKLFLKADTVYQKRASLSLSMQKELKNYFKEDIIKLQNIIKRDLSHWM